MGSLQYSHFSGEERVVGFDDMLPGKQPVEKDVSGGKSMVVIGTRKTSIHKLLKIPGKPLATYSVHGAQVAVKRTRIDAGSIIMKHLGKPPKLKTLQVVYPS